MKKKQFDLSRLRVQSFVTKLDGSRGGVRGGAYLTQFNCPDSWDCTDPGGSDQPLPCMA